MELLRYLRSGVPSAPKLMVGTLILFGFALLLGASLWFAVVVDVLAVLAATLVNAASRAQDCHDADMEDAAEADGR